VVGQDAKLPRGTGQNHLGKMPKWKWGKKKLELEIILVDWFSLIPAL
jgi:hypothetical protein